MKEQEKDMKFFLLLLNSHIGLQMMNSYVNLNRLSYCSLAKSVFRVLKLKLPNVDGAG